MKNKNKLRLSHSLLLCWLQGRYQDAIDLYLHHETPKSEAMEDGIEHHKKWSKIITKTNKLKIGNTTFEFIKPEVEKEIVVPYDRYDLKGVYDCIDGDTIYEWKTGVMSSLEYIQGYQLALYFLIAKLSKIQIQKGILAHYNQHEDKADIMIVYNTPILIEKATNLIETIAPEIEKYFKEKKILS